MDWLILRDVLNTACNITSAAYKGVVDTADQVVCTVGQTDGHSSPDHTMRRADIKWNSLGPQANLLMHPSSNTGSVLVLLGLIGSAKGHL